MPLRNRHRKAYLVRDDESDFVYYSDQVVTRWDGLVVKKSQDETRNPQEFIKAKNDPKALTMVRPDVPVVVTSLAEYFSVGNTNIRNTVGPATHLTRTVRNNIILIGIGDMVIESPLADVFIVS